MPARWLQGVINHATFVMVDSTDFASPESAMSAATKMRIYGKLLGNSGLFFVTSGTGSLAASNRDLVHVGPSATGVYTVPIGTAQMSDLSNVMYDEFIFIASATGAAYQTLIFSGVRASLSDILSTMGSQFAYLSGAISDVDSALTSQFVNQSNFISNFSNYLSNISALLSDVDSAITSRFSDLMSRITTTGVSLTAETLSDIRSAITAAGGGGGATPSAMWAYDYGLVTVVSSMGSLVRKSASGVSDTYSVLISRVPDITTTGSDLVSAIWAHAVASDLVSKVSDLRSRMIVANSAFSNYLSNLSAMLSDVDSALTSQFVYTSLILSDLNSRVDSTVPSRSQISDLISDLRSFVAGRSQLSDLISDVRSLMTSASWLSDMASHVWTAKYTGLSGPSSFGSLVSDMSSRLTLTYIAATAGASRALLNQSTLSTIFELTSDVDSALTSRFSDLMSHLTTTGVSLTAETLSDIRSAITAAGGGTGATASQVWTYTGNERALTAEGNSDVASAIWAHTTASDLISKVSDLRSRVIVANSAFSQYLSNLSAMVSDIDSALTSQFVNQSNFFSHISNYLSHLSDLTSNAYSAAAQANSRALVAQSTLSTIFEVASDAASAAQQGNSRALVNQSRMSDIYELLSDVDSALTSQFAYATYASGVLSDLDSRVPGRVLVRADTMAELTQAIPSATPNFEQAMMLLYAGVRNKTKTTGTYREWYNDAGTMIVRKPIQASGGSFLESEMIAGV